MHRKLRGPVVGNNTWWHLVKEKQWIGRQDSISTLNRQDGTAATRSKEKTQLLAHLFPDKMKVEAPQLPPPRLQQQCENTATKVEVMREQVKRLLRELDTTKATGPDTISLYALKQSTKEY